MAGDKDEKQIDVKFTLDGSGGLQPRARMWIDTDANNHFDDNEELVLEQEVLTWTGKKSTKARLTDVTFFVKYLAPIGAKWTLKITTGEGDDAKVLYKQKGAVGQQPSWITGALDDSD